MRVGIYAYHLFIGQDPHFMFFGQKSQDFSVCQLPNVLTEKFLFGLVTPHDSAQGSGEPQHSPLVHAEIFHLFTATQQTCLSNVFGNDILPRERKVIDIMPFHAPNITLVINSKSVWAHHVLSGSKEC